MIWKYYVTNIKRQIKNVDRNQSEFHKKSQLVSFVWLLGKYGKLVFPMNIIISVVDAQTYHAHVSGWNVSTVIAPKWDFTQSQTNLAGEYYHDLSSTSKKAHSETHRTPNAPSLISPSWKQNWWDSANYRKSQQTHINHNGLNWCQDMQYVPAEK